MPIDKINCLKDLTVNKPNGYQCFKGKSLTPAETKVLTLLGQPFSRKEICAMLRITIKTMEKHTQRIHYKLGIPDRVGLVHYALAKGLCKNAYTE